MADAAGGAAGTPGDTVPSRNLHRIAFAAGLLGFAGAFVFGLVSSFAAGRGLPDVILDERGLGDTYFEAGDHLAAAAEYRSAVAVTPATSLSLRKLRDALAAAGSTEAARSVSARLAQSDPTNVTARNDLGLMLHDRGKYGEAVTEFERALAVEPTHAATWIHLGNALLPLQEFERAEEAYLEAMKIDSSSADAWNGLGAVHGSQGRFDLAVSHFAEAVRLAPDDPSVAGNLDKVRQLMAEAAEAGKVAEGAP